MDKPVESPSRPDTTARPAQPDLIRDPDPATDPDLWRGSTPPDPAAWTPAAANPDPWGTDIGLSTAVRSSRSSWSPNRRTTPILAVVLVALLALIASIVILMTREPASRENPVPAPSTSPTTTTPMTMTSAPPRPPAPPPPPPSEEPSPAQPNYSRTYYPRSPTPARPNVTTPQTRGPDISVRPSHRPAFPGQPGEN